jgi:hypothetical protein
VFPFIHLTYRSSFHKREKTASTSFLKTQLKEHEKGSEVMFAGFSNIDRRQSPPPHAHRVMNVFWKSKHNLLWYQPHPQVSPEVIVLLGKCHSIFPQIQYKFLIVALEEYNALNSSYLLVD